MKLIKNEYVFFVDLLYTFFLWLNKIIHLIALFMRAAAFLDNSPSDLFIFGWLEFLREGGRPSARTKKATE